MSIVDQLKSLQELYDKGILDDAQFNAAKNKLLGIEAEPEPPSAAPPGNLASALRQAMTTTPQSKDGLDPSRPDTLRAAIEAAAPGATLKIPAGTWPCSLVIDKDLTLIGEGEVVLTPLEPDGERAHFARVLPELGTLWTEQQELEQQREATSVVFMLKRSRLAKKIAALKKKRTSLTLTNRVQTPIITVKNARVTLKRLRLAFPEALHKALYAEEHRLSMGFTRTYYRITKKRECGMVRAELVGADHGLIMEDCTLDGGRFFSYGVYATSRSGASTLQLTQVRCQHLFIDRSWLSNPRFGVFDGVKAGFYVDWLSKGSGKIMLRNCTVEDAFSGVYLKQCQEAVVEGITLKDLAHSGIRVYSKGDRKKSAFLTLKGGTAVDIEQRVLVGYAWSKSDKNFTMSGLSWSRCEPPGFVQSEEMKVASVQQAAAKPKAAKPKAAKPKAAKPKAKSEGIYASRPIDRCRSGCEVCGDAITGTLHYSHGRWFRDRLDRGYFCSAECLLEGYKVGHHGSPHSAFQKGDTVRLMNDTYLLNDAETHEAQVKAGTTATVLTAPAWEPRGGYSVGNDGQIDLAGPFQSISIRCSGQRYDHVYVGDFELVRRK